MSPRLTWLAIVIGRWGALGAPDAGASPPTAGRFGHRPWVEPSDDVRKRGRGGVVDLKLDLTL